MPKIGQRRAPSEPEKCVACSGSGKASNGSRCVPCNGKGVKK